MVLTLSMGKAMLVVAGGPPGPSSYKCKCFSFAPRPARTGPPLAAAVDARHAAGAASASRERPPLLSAALRGTALQGGWDGFQTAPLKVSKLCHCL